MEVGEATVIEVTEASQVGQARREALHLARDIGLDENDCGRAGLVVTEAATNLAKHAQGGRLVLLKVAGADRVALVAMALDAGPGVEHLDGLLLDGYSTSGSPGTGLGAIARQSSSFDIHSQSGRGTGVLMAIWAKNGPKPSPLRDVGGLSVAVHGETLCGDTWAVAEERGRRTILVADGLGHGAAAHEASQAARQIFLDCVDKPTPEIVERIHAALRATRGAAVGVCRLDPHDEVVRFCGVGNITGRIIEGDKTRGLVSHHGTAGSDARRIQEFSYPWRPGAILVLASDGLTTRWDQADHPGLFQHEPNLIAGILYRHHAREKDDVTVVVARHEAA